MAYTFEFVAPDSVDAGEPFVPTVEICCDNPDGCTDEDFEMSLEGNVIATEGMSFNSDFCTEPYPGQSNQGDPDPTESWYDIEDNELIINEPGEYEFSYSSSTGDSDSTTITVEDVGPDVSVEDCSISDDHVKAGEPVTLTATVQNAGGGGEFTATLSDQDGEIRSETFEIDADASRDIEFEVTYDTPNADGYELSVGVSAK